MKDIASTAAIQIHGVSATYDYSIPGTLLTEGYWSGKGALFFKYDLDEDPFSRSSSMPNRQAPPGALGRRARNTMSSPATAVGRRVRGGFDAAKMKEASPGLAQIRYGFSNDGEEIPAPERITPFKDGAIECV
jgi:hypothetical protein